MALADFAEYKERTAAPHQTLPFVVNQFFSTGTGWNSGWRQTHWIGGRGAETAALPGASAAVDRTTTGAFGQRNPAVADGLRVWLRSLVHGNSNVFNATLMIADRLVQSGGLDGTVTGAQSTNLPTAALTRYTSGTGVLAGVEMYTTIGSTPTTMTYTYTDDAGNGGQVGPAIDIGGSTRQQAGRFLMLPLLPGDGGVRAVASVNLAGSTGTAGNFGITLFKPLAAVPLRMMGDNLNSGDPLRVLGGALPAVVDDACLFFLVLGGGQASSGLEGELAFVET